MNQAMELISFWSDIAGKLISFYGLVENRKTQTLLGLLFFTISVLLALRLVKLKRYIKSTNTIINDQRIDALNVANIARDHNRSLKVQEARHSLKVKGNDLSLNFDYSGYCKAKMGENGFVFSVDSDVNVPFEKLACYGFDLLNDPRKTHKIRPLLLGADGLTKKIRLPFVSPLLKGDQFHVALFCELPGCIKFGKDYVTATLAFRDNTNIKNFCVKLKFLENHPKWVRLYDTTSGEPKLIKDLKPKCRKASSIYYEENYRNTESDKTFVYFFER